ncbi:unnamed protein product [Closterium sp. NIES-54]
MSPRVACSASSLACAAVHSLRRGSAVRCPLLLLVPATKAPFHTLHLDVWDPSPVRGPSSSPCRVWGAGGAVAEGEGTGAAEAGGVDSGGAGGVGVEWQLRGPVYGLRQAPREWHGTPRTILAALDFFPSSADASLFVRRGSTPFFVLIYVDNLVFATPDRQALASVKEEMQRRHTCTDLGELQRYLGRQITRERAARIITLM